MFRLDSRDQARNLYYRLHILVVQDILVVNSVISPRSDRLGWRSRNKPHDLLMQREEEKIFQSRKPTNNIM